MTEPLARSSAANNPPGLPPRCERALPGPPAHAEALGYRDDLGSVRSFIASRAEQAGLASSRISDLVIAVSELAADTVRHTGGDGTVQIWYTRQTGPPRVSWRL
jgi:hypothetical protein